MYNNTPLLCLFVGILLIGCIPGVCAQAYEQQRGALVFEFANADLEVIGTSQYFSFDVMLSSPVAGQRLGTGIVLLNYSALAFGYGVRANNNVIVTAGELLTLYPLPIYNLILNDNSPTRLAITYEFMVVAGYGGLVEAVPRKLMNIKFKVLELNHYAGISFFEPLMAGEQYMDNNATLFHPVVANAVENSLIPSPPVITGVTQTAGFVALQWQPIPDCTYDVYSSGYPQGDWQLEVSGLTVPNWVYSATDTRKFFSIIAHGNPGSNKGVHKCVEFR